MIIPGFDFLGMTPKGLICNGEMGVGSVPIRSVAFSPDRYSEKDGQELIACWSE